MRFALHVVFALLLTGTLHAKTSKEYLIEDFGAKGDGLTLNTEAIQSAIDKASAKGGGKVVVPEGVFLSGTLLLKSGVELWLHPNALLLGSTNIFDYRKIGHSFAFIISQNQHNVSITGKGTIDGQGRKLALNADSLYHIGLYEDPNYNYYRMRLNRRPKVIEFYECKDVHVTGVTIKNSAFWVQSYIFSEDVTIDSIHVDSDCYWNNDGIDIQDSKRVRVTNSYVNSADDGICLKSDDPHRMNEDIYIANCTIRSSASAVKFGTSSYGGFKNVKIENIKVFDTFRSAIAIESVDGGILENVEVSNIEAVNTGNAIFIRLGHRNEEGQVGTLKNVTIKNVNVQIPFERPDINYDLRGPDLPFFHNPFPGSITGIPGYKVENVLLENINITYPGRANKGMAYIPVSRLTQVLENEAGYPEFSMFKELPAWGFYVRHVSGLVMKNIKIRVNEDDFRPACIFDDVENLTLEDVQITSGNANDNQIVIYQTELKKAEQIWINGTRQEAVYELEKADAFRAQVE